MADVFISYTRVDERWAEWVAWQLEAAGLSTLLQKWDFGPGSNFVLQMQRATAESDRTLAVLSPDYLKSAFAAPEWAAAFARDPRGESRKLVPIRVRECDPSGLLGQVVYIDLVGLDEDTARETLLARLGPGRAKPARAPSFPGCAAEPAPFPAAPPRIASTRLRRAPTDLDKRRFFREAFATIAEMFRSGLDALKRDNAEVETDFDMEANASFRAEIYVHGKLRANCKIWVGGLHGGDGISFAQGSTVTMGNAINESLTIAQGDELALAALMNMGVGKQPQGVNPNHMSAEEAGQYLWSRFLWALT